tara:strand:+ start:24878 stop:25162 length:285 start_codon:yes stop_codon:yes gene_type:complete
MIDLDTTEDKRVWVVAEEGATDEGAMWVLGFQPTEPDMREMFCAVWGYEPDRVYYHDGHLRAESGPIKRALICWRWGMLVTERGESFAEALYDD